MIKGDGMNYLAVFYDVKNKGDYNITVKEFFSKTDEDALMKLYKFIVPQDELYLEGTDEVIKNFTLQDFIEEYSYDGTGFKDAIDNYQSHNLNKYCVLMMNMDNMEIVFKTDYFRFFLTGSF